MNKMPKTYPWWKSPGPIPEPKPRASPALKPKVRADPYPKGWAQVRQEVLERDGHACRVCGADAVESVLHIHHIDRNKQNVAMSNLVTLCSCCHGQLHLEDYLPGDWPDLEPPWGDLTSDKENP